MTAKIIQGFGSIRWDGNCSLSASRFGVANCFFRPLRGSDFYCFHPGLAPLRQVHGKLNAAFFRRCAATLLNERDFTDDKTVN